MEQSQYSCPEGLTELKAFVASSKKPTEELTTREVLARRLTDLEHEVAKLKRSMAIVLRTDG